MGVGPSAASADHIPNESRRLVLNMQNGIKICLRDFQSL